MAIEFESNQDKKQQEILQAEENAIAEKEGRKPKQIKVKKSKKSAIRLAILEKWCIVCVLSE